MIPQRKRLKVIHESRTVGIIEQTSDGRLGFSYSDEWLASGDAWPISQSVPLRPGLATYESIHRFFANLLPEGRLRYLVCRRLGISEDNDFELLKAIGGECAGALMIVPEDWSAADQASGEYRELTNGELSKIVLAGSIYPVFAHEGKIRLSLAGAQDKLPVVCKDGRIFIPSGSAASSHILKFGNPDFKYLPENEVLTTWIAREIGLPVVDADLLDAGGTRICRVLRYDRRRDTAGALCRIHQEDFCQVLGFPSQRKYELEGGPSFASCVTAVRDIVDNPLSAIEALLRWHLFNALAGNADGHAKNCSIVYPGLKSAALAPFYDLVCTALYPTIDSRIAMAIGGCVDSGQLTADCWKKMATELGIGYPFLRDLVRTMATTLPDKAEAACTAFRAHYGDHSIISRLQALVYKRCRRIGYLIGQ